MKKYLLPSFFLIALTAIIFVNIGGQQCERYSDWVVGYRGGDDSTLASLEGITNDTVGFHLRLNYKGANFIPTANYPVTTNWRMTGAAADFNGDGFVDLAEGGRGTDNNGDPNDTNLAIFISRGRDPADDTRFAFDGPYYIDYTATLTTYEIMSLGSGDYDGDGDADLSFLSWSGRLWILKNLYVENGLVPGDLPEFESTPTLIGDLINDGYGEFGSAADHWRWESNIASVDVDGDRDLDLIVGIPSRWAWNRYGEVVVFINNGSGVFSRLPQTINPYPNRSQYIYGVCAVAAGDFDKDGDIDFIVGSANSRDMYFYRNDGGTFVLDSRKTITIANRRGSCTLLREGDLDNDGDLDFVLATDGWTENPPGGYVYWYENNGTGNFTPHPLPPSGAQLSPSGDLDSGAVGDFDNDGDLDIFVADGNDSRNCYFLMNDIWPTYVARGTVYSKNLLPCSFITSDYAVVSATIRVEHTIPPGTTITYYLSNSNNANGTPRWEGPVTPNLEFEFESPGDFLRWEAIFTTQDEYNTPKIFTLDIEYKYIGKREYSRTSQAFTLVDVDSAREGDEEVLYSASFEFPKWKGHLRSWDVTNLNLVYNRGTQLEEIRDVGAEYVEDAGIILRDRNYSSRIVYTAYAAQADGRMNDRLPFNASSADELDDFLGLGIGSPEVVPLIEFVLGRNRAWKLGDINHSSPKVLEPPRGVPGQMGPGYETFQANNADRQKVIFVGSNYGMLHCFDAITLEELWAFIPHNLLGKLKRTRVVDPDCGEYLFHEFFVDGTPAIADVYFGGGWHTVLVCGQGPGWGLNHKCYYFALDVTDPLAPQPLWEVTDAMMGETWSVPAIGHVESINRWVAFFGSGYDNDLDPTVDIGHYFYAVDIETGNIIGSYEIVENREPVSPFGIQNTLPGSPALADVDRDGYADAVYFCDLVGRAWKIDLADVPGTWSPEVIYQDPYYQPIITRPTLYVNFSTSTVHLHFGTGGDDLAPATEYYSFVALKDGVPPVVEWYIGPNDLASELGISIATKKGAFVLGEKVWADPVIVDRLVYIATLEGSIESLNPCTTLAGSGKIYVRYSLGNQAGGTAILSPTGGPVAYLETKQKVRSAVTTGEIQTITQTNQEAIAKRKVFIQSYTQPAGEMNPEPPSQVLAQPVQQNALMIKSWREVYKIFKR